MVAALRRGAKPSRAQTSLVPSLSQNPLSALSGWGTIAAGSRAALVHFAHKEVRSLVLSQYYPHPPCFYRHALHPCSWLHGTHGESQPSWARQAVNGGDRHGSGHHQEKRNGEGKRKVCARAACAMFCDATRQGALRRDAGQTTDRVRSYSTMSLS